MRVFICTYVLIYNIVLNERYFKEVRVRFEDEFKDLYCKINDNGHKKNINTVTQLRILNKDINILLLIFL